MKKLSIFTLLFSLAFAQESLEDLHKKEYSYTEMIRVTATAYCSRVEETDDTPFLAAWKNRLDPKVKSIAVSRDLFEVGLTNGKRIHIDGLEGEYIVRDVMNKRWTNRIDVYMGVNKKSALKFGKQKVMIRWEP